MQKSNDNSTIEDKTTPAKNPPPVLHCVSKDATSFQGNASSRVIVMTKHDPAQL